jgi:hypothetical protein
MKHQRIYLIFYLSFIIIFLSCSSVKIKNITNKGKNIRKIENVEIIAQNENIKHNGERIGDFVIKENPLLNAGKDIDWIKVRAKMVELAISSGANLIEIKKIGSGIKGNIFYVDGSLFYSENRNLNSKKITPCNIVVFRQEIEGIIPGLFKINIKINEKEFKNIRVNNFAKVEFENCNQNVELTINKEKQILKLNGESKYYKASKASRGSFANGGIQIGVGGVTLVEMKHKELGKLMMLQNR